MWNLKLVRWIRKTKQMIKVPIETWLHSQKPIQTKDVWKNTNNLTIIDYKAQKRKIKRTLDQKPYPVSPTLQPFYLPQPTVLAKKYRWCACGLSKSQPFCDNSHAGTSFLPVRFLVVKKCEGLNLCGCKHTQNAPFCDGKTCKQIKQGVKVIKQSEDLNESQKQ